MQSGIIEWMQRLYDHALPRELDARKTLGIPRDVPEDFPSEAVALGLWNIIPLGEGASSAIGIFMLYASSAEHRLSRAQSSL